MVVDLRSRLSLLKARLVEFLARLHYRRLVSALDTLCARCARYEIWFSGQQRAVVRNQTPIKSRSSPKPVTKLQNCGERNPDLPSQHFSWRHALEQPSPPCPSWKCSSSVHRTFFHFPSTSEN